jgi:hypothetical protein
MPVSRRALLTRASKRQLVLRCFRRQLEIGQSDHADVRQRCDRSNIAIVRIDRARLVHPRDGDDLPVVLDLGPRRIGRALLRFRIQRGARHCGNFDCCACVECLNAKDWPPVDRVYDLLRCRCPRADQYFAQCRSGNQDSAPQLLQFPDQEVYAFRCVIDGSTRRIERDCRLRPQEQQQNGRINDHHGVRAGPPRITASS